MPYKPRYDVGSHYGPGQKKDDADEAENVSLREKLYGNAAFDVVENISYITPIISVFLICYFCFM